MDERKAGELVRYAALCARTTFSPDVLEGIGYFAGLYRMRAAGMKEPVLVASCDGVGTKVQIAQTLARFRTVGIDLVAMNVNDVATTGARVLFLLDYLAIGKIHGRRERDLLKGVASGCREAGCALLGGETAQMFSVYGQREFDLAAFCVGIVDRKRVLGPLRVRDGDCIIGLGSSGLHSNGYSLVHTVLDTRERALLQRREKEFGCTLGEELLKPTRIYSPVVAELAEMSLLNAAAHITGGGIPGNLVRVLPDDCGAVVRKGSWEIPPVFPYLQRAGTLGESEMYDVFNMGLGMMLVCSEKNRMMVEKHVRKRGMESFRVGRIEKGRRQVVLA